MGIISKVLIGLIGIQHLYFLYFEMFAWMTLGKKIFYKYPAEYFESTKVLAANQGLYNGFLAAGLIWSLLISDVVWSKYVALFFLSCVAIAGIYGAYSADKKIFFLQGLPAIITLILVWIYR